MRIQAKQYSYIAEIYNQLMLSVDYKDWADYIYEICEGYALKPDIVLELASGTCVLANHLSPKFNKIITTDLSIEMLKQLSCTNTNSVCCNMTAMPFKNKFQFLISAFDSVNYLLNETEVEKLFTEIFRLLSPEGIFTFDVSLEPNSVLNVEHLNREGEYKGISYIQKSEYDTVKKLHSNNFELTFNDGTIITETHIQKIYDFNYYFEVINNAGLYVSECFEAFSFDDADENSERVQFIVKQCE
jgi:ubiquinone/menaquinone biosynthesis C-methylase UbiE